MSAPATRIRQNSETRPSAHCPRLRPLRPWRLTARTRANHSEWGVNQHRDSLALYVGFDPLAQYIAIAENEAVGRLVGLAEGDLVAANGRVTQAEVVAPLLALLCGREK